MKAQTHTRFNGAHLEMIAASEASCRKIPPLWPLSSSVAVNPFLGQTNKTLAEVSALLSRVAGITVTMPNSWYQSRIVNGTISDADLIAALDAASGDRPKNLLMLKAAAIAPDDTPKSLPTIADLAKDVSSIDWPSIVTDRIGTWASGYFDEGQALWQVTPRRNTFESWKLFASSDLTPEIAGLSSFTSNVAALPAHSRAAFSLANDTLYLTPDVAVTYYHQLLLGMGGWSQLARYRLWQAELKEETDPITTDMLTIRLIWEQALFLQYGPQIATRWANVRATHASPYIPTPAQISSSVLQDASERAAQRNLADILSSHGQDIADARPSLQVAFCIDVRSEVYRRALESLDPSIQTLGFAGFFGLSLSHHEFASDIAETRLPAILHPSLQSAATHTSNADADETSRLVARAERAWGRFKLAAVSSFAFVEATGPLYAAKLIRDALGLPHAAQRPAPQPYFSDAFILADRIVAVATILRAMSLTDNFAPIVLLLGHGANVVNNPHESALQCGACGGYKGDVNARLLAGMLNNSQVRTELAIIGINIDKDTIFIAGLHDTTTDLVTLFDSDNDQTKPEAQIKVTKKLLETAGKLTRTERALRLPRTSGDATIISRSIDWAETRPEWALAGCNAFIAAPRHRTRGKPLNGRAFLHDYDWTKDDGFSILELILTGPVVVASWISLQYYGSVVAPDTFGAGNKLLHNVTGGIGVVEGNGGNLRTGLPKQSVHDGSSFVHEPLRLSVCIEAPINAISNVLACNLDVKALFDNQWLNLLLLNDKSKITKRYVGNSQWQPFDP